MSDKVTRYAFLMGGIFYIILGAFLIAWNDSAYSPFNLAKYLGWATFISGIIALAVWLNLRWMAVNGHASGGSVGIDAYLTMLGGFCIMVLSSNSALGVCGNLNDLCGRFSNVGVLIGFAFGFASILWFMHAVRVLSRQRSS